MFLMIVLLTLWILILVYNAIYSLLPSNIQSLKFVKFTAIIVAIIILVRGITQEIQKYRKFRFALVSSKDGTIIKKKNFPWNVTKTKTPEGNIVYIINERYGDASEIIIKGVKGLRYSVHNATDGVGIEFLCAESEIQNFKIIISDL